MRDPDGNAAVLTLKRKQIGQALLSSGTSNPYTRKVHEEEWSHLVGWWDTEAVTLLPTCGCLGARGGGGGDTLGPCLLAWFSGEYLVGDTDGQKKNLRL